MSSEQSKTNPLQLFLNEEQDPAAVETIYKRVSQVLMKGEEIAYIAVQKKPIGNLSPDAVVLTDKRFMIYKPKLLGGSSFIDYVWRDLSNCKIDEGLMGAKITIQTTRNSTLIMDYLPKAQARKVYQYAQEKEEAMLELRRQREMEEKRAAAGGIYFQGQIPQAPVQQAPAAPTTDDPVAKLQKLKTMLEAGLISQDEYDAKKADILSRM